MNEVGSAGGGYSPSARSAENASMASYNSYSSSSSGRSSNSSASRSVSSYDSSSPTHRDAERSSMASYNSSRYSGGGRSSRSSYSSGRSDSDNRSTGSLSRNYDSDTDSSYRTSDRRSSDYTRSHREAESGSMATYRSGLATRAGSSRAQSDWAASVAAAQASYRSETVSPHTSRGSDADRAENQPSAREAEIARMGEIRRSEIMAQYSTTREAPRGHLSVSRRQAEIESMEALADYRDEQEVIARKEVRSQYPDRATPAEDYADKMAAHQKATRIEARADQVHELGRAALVVGGAIGLKINQQGLNQAASILSRSAPLYQQTVQQLTFSMGTAGQKIGAAVLAANVSASKTIGRSLGFLGFTNPNYASTAVVKDASRWTLSGKAQSTQALWAAERLRGPVSKLTMGTYVGALGLEVGLRAYAEGLRGTTREEMITNAIIGGLKASDNAVLNTIGALGGGGIGGLIGGFVTLPALGSGGSYGAVAGAYAGIETSDRFYRDKPFDRTFDEAVESKRDFVNDHVTPGVIAVDDWIDRNQHWLAAIFGAPGVPHGDVSIPRPPMREISIPMPRTTPAQKTDNAAGASEFIRYALKEQR